MDELERAGLRLGQGRDDGHQRAVAAARRRGSRSDGVPAARRQAAPLHRLGRPADSGGRPRELLRGNAEEDGRHVGHRGVREAVHGSGDGSLCRRHEPESLRRARGARTVGRKRDGARADDRFTGGAGRYGAYAAAVSVSAGREVERQRQFGRRGEFQLSATLNFARLKTTSPTRLVNATNPDNFSANISRLSTWTIGTIASAMYNSVIRKPDSAAPFTHSGAGGRARSPVIGSANITR